MDITTEDLCSITVDLKYAGNGDFIINIGKIKDGDFLKQVDE